MTVYSRIFARDAARFDAFPNYDAYANAKGRGVARSIVAEERLAFFSEFGEFFNAKLARLFHSRPSKPCFDRAEWTTATELSRRASSEFLEWVALRSEKTSETFAIVASVSFFQAFWDAELGFDVAKLCDPSAPSFLPYNATRTTDLERRVLKTEASAFGSLYPFSDDANRVEDWRVLDFGNVDAARAVEFLGDLNVLVETRSFSLGSIGFSWSIAFARTALFGDRARRSAPTRVETNAKKNVLEGTLDNFDANGTETVEVVVEICRDETTDETWNALRPGSILTTNASADDLFVAWFDRRPAYYVKPGAYRGAPAVQIKDRIDSSPFENGDEFLDELFSEK